MVCPAAVPLPWPPPHCCWPSRCTPLHHCHYHIIIIIIISTHRYPSEWRAPGSESGDWSSWPLWPPCPAAARHDTRLPGDIIIIIMSSCHHYHHHASPCWAGCCLWSRWWRLTSRPRPLTSPGPRLAAPRADLASGDFNNVKLGLQEGWPQENWIRLGFAFLGSQNTQKNHGIWELIRCLYQRELNFFKNWIKLN